MTDKYTDKFNIATHMLRRNLDNFITVIVSGSVGSTEPNKYQPGLFVQPRGFECDSVICASNSTWRYLTPLGLTP